MTESFQEVKNQPIESNKYADFTKNPANFGVVKRLRDNDPELHENQTMYSCGSLAPKMQRTGGGCGDCKFKKPSEPWEAADGCVYLANELAEIPELQEPISNLLPQIQETARHRHYTMHYYFIESVAKVLPLLAKKLGKKLFKPYLEGFFNCLFYAIESENALASSASTECLKQLSGKNKINHYNLSENSISRENLITLQIIFFFSTFDVSFQYFLDQIF